MQIARRRGDNQTVYDLAGLPEGAGFRNPDNYERLTVDGLTLDGAAFDCKVADIGEYKVTLAVEIVGSGEGEQVAHIRLRDDERARRWGDEWVAWPTVRVNSRQFDSARDGYEMSTEGDDTDNRRASWLKVNDVALGEPDNIRTATLDQTADQWERVYMGSPL